MINEADEPPKRAGSSFPPTTVDTVVLSGASTFGFHVLGALHYFFDHVHAPSCGLGGRVRGVKKYIATSSGFLISVLLSLGYYPAEILARVAASGFVADLAASIDPARILATATGCASLDPVVLFLGDAMEARGVSRDATLVSVMETRGVVLVGCAYDLTEHAAVYFSPATHPHVRVVDVARATCSIPVLFDHAHIDGKTYVDGGVVDNFPIGVADVDGGDVVFGVSVTTAPAARRQTMRIPRSNTHRDERCRAEDGPGGVSSGESRAVETERTERKKDADTGAPRSELESENENENDKKKEQDRPPVANIAVRCKKGIADLFRVIALLQSSTDAAGHGTCCRLAGSPANPGKRIAGAGNTKNKRFARPVVLTLRKSDFEGGEGGGAGVLEFFDFTSAGKNAPVFYEAGFRAAMRYFKKIQ